MQTAEKRKTWDLSRFRGKHMTFWPRGHPVMFSHVVTDHWSKMKTTVPDYFATIPAALLKDTAKGSHKAELNYTEGGGTMLPPLTKDATMSLDAAEAYSIHGYTNKIAPQNMPHYKNVFNEHARRGFCYWLVEKKSSACKGSNIGAYKTSLGLPKM